mgnify:CR=1 FL=1
MNVTKTLNYIPINLEIVSASLQKVRDFGF